MLARGTPRRSVGQVRRQVLRRAARRTRAMKASAERRDRLRRAPSARCRQASTAASSSSPVFDGIARARRAAPPARSRFASGREGSGGRPVDAATQRSYGTGSPAPRISIARSHIAERQSAEPVEVRAAQAAERRGPPSPAPSIAPFTSTAARYASIAARSGSFADDAAALAHASRPSGACRPRAAARPRTRSRR